MIVQNGRVIAGFGDVAKKVQIHSVRKSLMSALYGIAVARRVVDLNKTLAQLGVADSDKPQLEMLNQPWNQEPCKNASLTLDFSGSAGK